MKSIILINLLLFFLTNNINAQKLKWTYKYYGKEARDCPKAVTLDEDGNLYAAIIGESEHNAVTRGVIRIISLDNSGNLRWEYTYTHYEKYYDDAISIIYGKNGYIYFLGKSSNYSDDDYILVICLDKNGNVEWYYFYFSWGSDFAYSMVYGEDGNIYITGSSYGNLIVICLTNYGAERWVYEYKSSSGESSCGYSLCYAPDGNIYVAGVSEGDIIVISLNSSGKERWVFQYYDGFFFSSAHSICCDKNSNVYIFGVMDYENPIVMSFTSNGVIRWEYNSFEYKRNTSGPELLTPLICDGEGNIYTAYQAWPSGIFTVSLNTSGERRWDFLYVDNEKPRGIPYSIFSKNWESIYVVGETGYGENSDYILLNFKKDGNLNFILTEDLGKRDFATCGIEGLNNNFYIGIYLDTESYDNALFVSFDKDGNKLWNYEYDTYGCTNDIPNASDYDEEGNTYISVFSSNYNEFTVLCIDNSGKEKWRYREGNIYGTQAMGIVYGKDGNIYACGYTVKEWATSNIYIISFSKEGDILWTFDSLKGWADTIVYGYDGNLYVAGAKSYNKIFVLSLDKNGNFRWIYEYEKSDIYRAEDFRLIFGKDGFLYLMANLYNNNRSYEILILSLKRNGNLRWKYEFNEQPERDDKGKEIIFGEDGNIYFTGFTDSEETGMDIILVSLSSSGEERWIFKMDGGGGTSDEGNSLVYGKDGNIYLTGYYSNENFNRNLFVLSLDRNKKLKWIYTFDGGAKFEDRGNSILYGEDNHLYITGYSYNYVSEYDFLVISLNNSGEKRWIFEYNGPSNSYDEGLDLIFQKEKSITVAGITTGMGTNYDLTLIKLDTSDNEREIKPPKYVEGFIRF